LFGIEHERLFVSGCPKIPDVLLEKFDSLQTLEDFLKFVPLPGFGFMGILLGRSGGRICFDGKWSGSVRVWFRSVKGH
jgi:hypothetical protein